MNFLGRCRIGATHRASQAINTVSFDGGEQLVAMPYAAGFVIRTFWGADISHLAQGTFRCRQPVID